MKSPFYKLIFLIPLGIAVIFSAVPIKDLCQSTFRAITDIKTFQSNLNTPQAGEHVLPMPVKEMLVFLRTHQVDTYDLSEQIKRREHMEVYQRIVESAWPKRPNVDSRYKLMFVRELENYSRCKIIERGKEAALVICP